MPENGVELRWLNRHDEIPDGWRVAQQSLVHHHRYAVLIERIP